MLSEILQEQCQQQINEVPVMTLSREPKTIMDIQRLFFFLGSSLSMTSTELGARVEAQKKNHSLKEILLPGPWTLQITYREPFLYFRQITQNPL